MTSDVASQARSYASLTLARRGETPSSSRRDVTANRAVILASLSAATADDGRRRPWPHQSEALDAISSHLRSGSTNAITVLPTAGGKTEVFQRIVSAAHRRAGELDLRTLVLVPTRQLITQTVERFRSEFPDVPVGCVGKGLPTSWQPVTVMTYARFISMATRGALSPSDVDLIVMDEAHRGLSELRQAQFKRFLGHAVVLAFSATPVFDVNKNVYALLGKSNEVAHVTVGRLIGERRIAPVVNVIAGVNLVGEMPDDPAVQARVLKAAATRAMLDLQSGTAQGALPVDLVGRTFVAYTFDIDHASTAAAAYVAERGGRAVGISYRTDDELQRKAISDLGRKELDGVFNAMVLLEGTDIPSLGSVYNLAPTTSLVRQMQRCGRALRLDPTMDPSDPRQAAVVVDLFFRINGKMVGKPVFYCDALGDRTIARAIELAPLDFTQLVETVGTQVDAETIRAKVLASDAEAKARSDGDADALEDGAGPVTRLDASADDDDAPDDGDEPTYVGAGGDVSVDDILTRLTNVRVTTVLCDVVSITNERDAARFSARADDGLLGRTDVAIALGVAVDTPVVRGFFESVEAECLPEFRKDPTATLCVERDGVVIDVRYRRTGFLHTIQYEAAQLDRFAALFDTTRTDKGEDWLNVTQVCGSMGQSGPWITVLRGLVAEYLSKRRRMALGSEPVRRRIDVLSRADADPSTAPGARDLRMELCRIGPTCVVCFHRDDLPFVRRMTGLEVDPALAVSEEWLGFEEVARELGMRSHKIRVTLQAIFALADDEDAKSTNGTHVTYEGRSFRVRRVSRGRTRLFHTIWKDDLDALVQAAGAVPAPLIDEGWLQRSDVAAAAGCTRNALGFRRVWERLVGDFESGSRVVLGPVRAWTAGSKPERICPLRCHLQIAAHDPVSARYVRFRPRSSRIIQLCISTKCKP